MTLRKCLPRVFVSALAALGLVVNLVGAASAQKPEPDPGFDPGPETDLSLDLDGPSSAVLVGDSGRLEFTLRNGGPEDASDVYLYGYLSDALRVTELDPDCSEDGFGGFSCFTGELDDGAEESFSVTVERVRARETWTSFSVSSSNYDPNYDNNYRELYLEPDTSNPADLAVSMDGPRDPDLGESFTYTIEVRNEGPQQAHLVELRDSVPAGVDVLSWDSSLGEDACRLDEQDPYEGAEGESPDGGADESVSPEWVYRELICSLGSIEPDERVSVELEVERTDPYELWNTAWVATSSYDSNYDNDFAYTTTSAHESVRSDLSIDVDGPSTVPLVGDRFELTYTAGNEGPAPVQDAWLTGFLPDGLAFEAAATDSDGVECSSNDAGGGEARDGATAEPDPAAPPSDEDQARMPIYYEGHGFNCALGSLADGESVEINVSVTRSKAGEQWATGSVWSSNVDEDYEDNYGEVGIDPDTSNPADLAVELTGPSDAEVGEEVEFELTATNNGPMEALSVELTDVLPYELDYVSTASTDPSDECVFVDGGPYGDVRESAASYYGYRELRCDLGNLASGESVTVTITATRNSEYEIWNSAYVSSASYDANLDNDYTAAKLDGKPYPCGPRPAGSPERDDIVAGDCPVESGAGDDSIAVQAGSERDVKVTSGGGGDSVLVNVTAGPSTRRTIEIATGPGADDVVVILAPGAAQVTVLVRTGDGSDRIRVQGAASRALLKLRGGLGSDSLTGSEGSELLWGGRGRDVLDGGAGDDTLDGGRGRDVCRGGPGTDTTNCS